MNLEEMVSSTIGEPYELDRSIQSLTIIKLGEAMSKLENRLRKIPDANPSTETIDTFLVSDMLRNASYVVSRFDSQIQLIVPSKGHLILVKLGSEADLAEVADTLLSQLPQ